MTTCGSEGTRDAVLLLGPLRDRSKMREEDGIDAGAQVVAFLGRISTLPLIIFVRRVRIPPSDTVPVVDVFVQHDELGAVNQLRSVKPLQQGIGRTARRASFGSNSSTSTGVRAAPSAPSRADTVAA